LVTGAYLAKMRDMPNRADAWIRNRQSPIANIKKPRKSTKCTKEKRDPRIEDHAWNS